MVGKKGNIYESWSELVGDMEWTLMVGNGLLWFFNR